jgi:hypothetical protein
MIRILIVMAVGLTGTLRGQEVECATIPDTIRIQVLGAFSDMRYTEEHAYGQTVELWRAGQCIFGFFEVAAGLAGDTPTGLLTQVRHNSETGALAFTAKLTTGLTYTVNSKDWVPSRDLFVFAGRLHGGVLDGKLRHYDQLRPDLQPVEQGVVLPRSKETQELMSDAATYGEWREQVQSIIRARGPKW